MDIVNYVQFITALLFVVALIALVGVIVRKTGFPGLVKTTVPGRKRTIHVVENTALDSKRRLIVVRWRGEDHLLMSGGGQDIHLSTKQSQQPAEQATEQKTPTDKSSSGLFHSVIILIIPLSRVCTMGLGKVCTMGFGCLFQSVIALIIPLCFVLLPTDSLAQALTLDLNEEIVGTGTSRILQMLALLTILSLAPGILVMITSFTRIIVVLSFLRTAMGIQQAPPSTVLISLALFLTAFIMQPTFEAIYDTAITPLLEEDIDEIEAIEKAVIPLRQFMMQQVREKDVALFMDLADVERVANLEDTPTRVLIPAFMISELRRAFEIGFLIFLPFLIIDMVVASVLMSMGMMMLPPVMISLPFKLIFFVLVDGWYLLSGSLVRSFATG